METLFFFTRQLWCAHARERITQKSTHIKFAYARHAPWKHYLSITWQLWCAHVQKRIKRISTDITCAYCISCVMEILYFYNLTALSCACLQENRTPHIDACNMCICTPCVMDTLFFSYFFYPAALVWAGCNWPWHNRWSINKSEVKPWYALFKHYLKEWYR